jgi:phosphonate metabolism protein PhnN/1,5-bisphosphokinase (PRPP-forming)
MAELEDHDSVTPEQFALHEANGDYALTWEAHGLKYGLPASIRDDIAMGRVVVMNGSRAMVPIARETLPGTVVVLVGASPQVRAQRLARRGRETAAQISARLAREVDVDIPNAILVDNSGELEQGKARFLAGLRSLRAN